MSKFETEVMQLRVVIVHTQDKRPAMCGGDCLGLSIHTNRCFYFDAPLPVHPGIRAWERCAECLAAQRRAK